MNIIRSKAGRKPKPTLKIGVDCGSLIRSSDKKPSGIATVTENLLHELSVLDKRNIYVLYSFNKIDSQVLDRFGGRIQNQVLWPAVGFKRFRLPLAIAQTKPDIFLALSQAMPSNAPPTLGFVYDVSFIKNPDFYSNPKKLKIQTEIVLNTAKQIITLSNTAKKEIVEFYPQVKDKISVVFPGVSSFFQPGASKYVDNFHYFVYVGQLKKSKNIPCLIHGFAKFLQNSETKHKLVLIGSSDNLDPEISKAVALNKLEDYVDYRDSVSQEELAKYYRGALAFVSPAFVEGFGLPLIEAMSCGTAVITSNVSSMPEIVGEAGILVDPTNPETLAKALENVATDAKKREQLIKLGLRKAKQFSWKQFAKTVLEKSYDLVKNRQDTNGTIPL